VHLSESVPSYWECRPCREWTSHAVAPHSIPPFSRSVHSSQIDGLGRIAYLSLIFESQISIYPKSSKSSSIHPSQIMAVKSLCVVLKSRALTPAVVSNRLNRLISFEIVAPCLTPGRRRTAAGPGPSVVLNHLNRLISFKIVAPCLTPGRRRTAAGPGSSFRPPRCASYPSYVRVMSESSQSFHGHIPIISYPSYIRVMSESSEQCPRYIRAMVDPHPSLGRVTPESFPLDMTRMRLQGHVRVTSKAPVRVISPGHAAPARSRSGRIRVLSKGRELEEIPISVQVDRLSVI
jgi:hypothetical protein